MTQFELASATRFGLQTSPSTFYMRLGRRELFICRDTYVRRYRVNPLIECSAGVEAGHLQILLLRRWLLVLSRAPG
ncbi:hypothetical protein RGU70_06780 [Herbaspirillum sp. RTI4]|uniref:hypothetical protein n=1 Tax=Herbaspirillum sp. RTI4 TaxID=3048640 RepID=UPI002AB38D94|nr:hypothetical protein [Herbaspirillum sp. RTI4]MDY7578020.1 hypothetical protein [Herbaspirillum sp. RTI4]MEA9982050.1 hypothetical protein [Herbaspirillum sp. RTI4]